MSFSKYTIEIFSDINNCATASIPAKNGDASGYLTPSTAATTAIVTERVSTGIKLEPTIVPS